MLLTGKQKILIIATVTVWSLALTIRAHKMSLAAKSELLATIETSPTNVRIFVNKESYANGDYIETPVTLSMRPGKNKVKVSREGYLSQTITIEGSAGEKAMPNPVILESNQNIDTFSLEVSGDSISSPYYIEVDRGLVRGQTPVNATDIPVPGPHTIDLFPKWPQKGSRLRCTFNAADTFKNTLQSSVVRVEIKKSGAKFKFLGCDQEKPKQGSSQE